MNAMEMRKKRFRRQRAKETLFGLGMGFGMAMVFAGLIGLLHGFHPVTLGMVIVGIILQVVIYWRVRW